MEKYSREPTNLTKIQTRDGFVRAGGSARLSEADMEALATLHGRFSKCVEHSPPLPPPDSDDDCLLSGDQPYFTATANMYERQVQEPFELSLNGGLTFIIQAARSTKCLMCAVPYSCAQELLDANLCSSFCGRGLAVGQ